MHRKPDSRPPFGPRQPVPADRSRSEGAVECRDRHARGRPARGGQHARTSLGGARRNQQATARYQAGLGNIDEVAEAQRLLTQAEIDDALARLGVWRGLLAVATARGDIQPFLAEASQ